ncbi:uncharacterized protein LOC34623659 [Cyclospora cayetanensis]|uniref:Uncharacterized protein LOC34623659 n=1 Tax=Cyclospora cayetanensis TaxID=88456 RepID=A0A6P6RQB1_9EIME|nr:uncharacterized protein LOC34623659 [Cyclospora cayetanensis]
MAENMVHLDVQKAGCQSILSSNGDQLAVIVSDSGGEDSSEFCSDSSSPSKNIQSSKPVVSGPMDHCGLPAGSTCSVARGCGTLRISTSNLDKEASVSRCPRSVFKVESFYQAPDTFYASNSVTSNCSVGAFLKRQALLSAIGSLDMGPPGNDLGFKPHTSPILHYTGACLKALRNGRWCCCCSGNLLLLQNTAAACEKPSIVCYCGCASALLLSFVMIVTLWGCMDIVVELVSESSSIELVYSYVIALAIGIVLTILLKLMEKHGFTFLVFPTMFVSLMTIVAAWGIIDELIDILACGDLYIAGLVYFVCFLLAALLVFIHACFCDKSFSAELRRLVCY